MVGITRPSLSGKSLSAIEMSLEYHIVLRVCFFLVYDKIKILPILIDWRNFYLPDSPDTLRSISRKIWQKDFFSNFQVGIDNTRKWSRKVWMSQNSILRIVVLRKRGFLRKMYVHFYNSDRKKPRVHSQCVNYWILLSRIFCKKSVKSTFLMNRIKTLNWFHGIFLSENIFFYNTLLPTSSRKMRRNLILTGIVRFIGKFLSK